MAPLSASLARSVWADSAADGGLSSEFMSAAILMLQKEKEKGLASNAADKCTR